MKTYVSVSEFRSNMGKYLDMALSEDVHILRHGKDQFILSTSDETRSRIIKSLKGAYSYDGNLDELLEKRLDDL